MRSVDPAPEPRQGSTNRTGSDFIGAWRRGPIAASSGPPAGVRHPPLCGREMAMGSVAHLEEVRIAVGVDTHRDEHVAVALDALGKKVATTSMPTTPKGYRDLLAWAEGLGAVEAWGVEGTGSYGAGVTRHLKSAEHLVHEVIRPNRSVRRRKGKSDLVDAEAAARAVQAGVAAGGPKSGEGARGVVRGL